MSKTFEQFRVATTKTTAPYGVVAKKAENLSGIASELSRVANNATDRKAIVLANKEAARAHDNASRAHYDAKMVAHAEGIGRNTVNAHDDTQAQHDRLSKQHYDRSR